MRGIKWTGVAAGLLLGAAPAAYADTLKSLTTNGIVNIADNYIGGDPTGSAAYNTDVIGSASVFDISSLDVNVNANGGTGSLAVTINSNYFKSAPGNYLNSAMGDLFISTNGWTPITTGNPATLDDTFYTGEKWEYVVVLSNHAPGAAANSSGNLAVYKLPAANTTGVGGYADSIRLSNEFFGASGNIYRADQAVQADTNALANAMVDGITGTYTRNTTDGSLTLSLSGNIIGGLGLDSNVLLTGIGFHWAMTCANDVIQGRILPTGEQNVVPEPTSLALAGLGLLTLAARRRRSR